MLYSWANSALWMDEHEWFKTLDVDGKGSIGPPELKKGLSALGLPCSQ